jgi:6,7-dimethyl-8-ribityllumazine synthase
MTSIGNGLQNFQLKYDIPVINGILTCETEEQIKQRTIFNNHGIHWAYATSMYFKNE